jgi:serine protease Do
VDRSFYTGLNVRPVSDRMARQMGLDEARGLIVSSVDDDSPAERAGLRAYDLIVSIGGEPVRTNEDVRQRLVDNRPGDTVELGVVREGRTSTARVVLGTTTG